MTDQMQILAMPRGKNETVRAIITSSTNHSSLLVALLQEALEQRGYDTRGHLYIKSSEGERS